MNKLFNISTNSNAFGSKDGALTPLFEDLDGYRQHFVQRKREIEELTWILSMRVEAESEYSARLFQIAERDSSQCISIGMLGQEVGCFKDDCKSKAKAAAELADNVAQDCVHPLKALIAQQDTEFRNIIGESKKNIGEIENLNSQIRSMAQRYFEASETAEKFIHNYQELKLNVDVAYAKRKSLHESVLNTIGIASERRQAYSLSIPGANESLEAAQANLKKLRGKIATYEEERCEQVHSSINQFVVFEKFAEMNNKYDVKNFSDLIDQFTLESEMKVISQEVAQRIEKGRKELHQTIFDPIIDPENRQKGTYEFSQYQAKRYDAIEMKDSDLLLAPPLTLEEHENKKELINFVLDKAFVQQPLNQEYLGALQQIFKTNENREIFLEFLSKDYHAYDLDHLRSDPVSVNTKVHLPYVIFGNLSDIFFIFLEAIDVEPINEVQLMRLMMFANLFQCIQQTNFQSGDNGKSNSSRLLRTLNNAHIWSNEEIWTTIAKTRLQHIDKNEVENRRSIIQSKEETKEPVASLDSELQLQDRCQATAKVIQRISDDMYICQLPQDRILDFIKTVGQDVSYLPYVVRKDEAFQKLVDDMIITYQKEPSRNTLKPKSAGGGSQQEGWVQLEKQNSDANPFQSASTEDANSGTPGSGDEPDHKQNNTQWLGGIETLLGGGYMSLGATKKRTDTLKNFSSRVSTLSNKTQKSLLSLYGNKGQSTVKKAGTESQEQFEFDPNQSPDIDAPLDVDKQKTEEVDKQAESDLTNDQEVTDEKTAISPKKISVNVSHIPAQPSIIKATALGPSRTVPSSEPTAIKPPMSNNGSSTNRLRSGRIPSSKITLSASGSQSKLAGQSGPRLPASGSGAKLTTTGSRGSLQNPHSTPPMSSMFKQVPSKLGSSTGLSTGASDPSSIAKVPSRRITLKRNTEEKK